MTSEIRDQNGRLIASMLMDRQHTLGIAVDGRYCLACGKPLYGPELSHTPPAQPSAVDRWRSG